MIDIVLVVLGQFISVLLAGCLKKLLGLGIFPEVDQMLSCFLAPSRESFDVPYGLLCEIFSAQKLDCNSR